MGEFIENRFTDDILIEVLKWLPVKALFDVKCVCKRWYTIISSCHFCKSYQFQRREQDDSLSSLLGFFRTEAEDAFLPTSSSPIHCFGCLNWDGDLFIGSSNGFLLYRNKTYMTYRVSNPVTKECFILARAHDRDMGVLIGFDVEESFDQKGNLRQLNFKLVFVLVGLSASPGFPLVMQMYSSETRVWKWCYLRLSGGGSIYVRPFEYAMIINGVYYWLGISNQVLAYDSNRNRKSHGPGDDILDVIELPERDGYIVERSSILGKSKDDLLQYGRSDSFKIVIWVRKPCVSNDGVDQYQWVLTQAVSFMQMSYQFPDAMSSCDLFLTRRALLNEKKANVPVLMAFHPLNPGAVFLRLDKVVFSYWLDDGRLELVHLQMKDYRWRNRSSSGQSWEWSHRFIVPYFSPKWASFYL